MTLSKWGQGITLCLASALCGGASGQVLFDQNNGCLANDHAALSSWLRRSTNVESAEDFVVPEGKLWRPNRIITQGSRDILDEQVRIHVYRDTEEVACPTDEPCPESLPTGDPICNFTGTAGKIDGNVPAGVFPFQVDLPENFCELAEGRYWMSITYIDEACGGGGPACEDWSWSENREFSDTREWVIRDLDKSSDEIRCDEFGLGNSCQSEKVLSQLCLAIEGESQNDRPPRANPDMLVETLFVGQSLKIELSEFVTEPNGQALTYSSDDIASFILLDSSGTLLIEPQNGDAPKDPVSTIRATDTSGLSDDLLVAVRTIEPSEIGLGDDFDSDVRIRCGSGLSGLEQGLDFSRPGDCNDGPESACDTIPAGAVVINTEVEVQLNHPLASDLALRLQNPMKTEVTLVNRPNFNQNAVTPSGDCDNPNIHGVFSDTHVWPAEKQCSSPIALAGDLEPSEQLARFRNQPGVGDQPWLLQLDNAGEEVVEFERWCLALQIDPSGAEIFPQAQLAGSGTFIDLRDVSEATVTATLKGPDDVHWYLVSQTDLDTVFYQEVDTTITPAPGQILRSHRYGNEKFSDFNPSMAIGNCDVSQELVYPRQYPEFGRDVIRVSGCGANAAGEYTLTTKKNVDGFFLALIPVGLGYITGQARDAMNGDPVFGAFIISGGASAFAGADGAFQAGVLVGNQTVTVFHPDYLPLSLDITGIEGVNEDIGVLELTPTRYQAVTDQIILETGFE
ncbi:MAG: hypothetical protein AB8B96_00640 [Lysobacterales bacterium]